MNPMEELERLKRRVGDLQSQKHRAEGRLQEAQERLKKEFQVNTLKAAEKLLKELEEQSTTAQEEFETALGAFKKEWGDKLE